MKPKFKLSHSSVLKGTSRIGLLAMIVALSCGFAAASNPWTLIPPVGSNVVDIEIGGGQVWALNNNDALLQYSGGEFSVVSQPFSLRQIAVGLVPTVNGNTEFVLGLGYGNDNIYQYDGAGSGLVLLRGQLQQIGGGNEGIWGINSAGEVYQYNPAYSDPWTKMTTQTFTGSIYVGDNLMGPWILGCPPLLNLNLAWAYPDYQYYPPQNFELTGNSLFTTLAVGANEIWGIVQGSGPNVREYDFSTSSWIEPDSNAVLTQVSAGVNSHIWGVNASGQVYEFNGTSFVLASPQPPEPIKLVRVTPAAYYSVYALGQSGNVYVMSNISN